MDLVYTNQEIPASHDGGNKAKQVITFTAASSWFKIWDTSPLFYSNRTFAACCFGATNYHISLGIT